MALWLIQPLTEMSTSRLIGGGEEGGGAQLKCKVDNLTAIC
jgi:hypothetical protein